MDTIASTATNDIAIAFKILQYITFIALLVILYFEVGWMKRHKVGSTVWLMELPWAILVTHMLIFYLAIFLETPPLIDLNVIPNQDIFFTSWSVIVRMHTVGTIGIYLWDRNIRENFVNKIRHKGE